jgi:predicted MarR family transcription regulator
VGRQELVAVAAKAIKAAIFPHGRARATVLTKLDVVYVIGGTAFVGATSGGCPLPPKHPILLLQGMAGGAGSVRRVPAADIEALVVRSVREHLKPVAPIDDRGLIDTHASRSGQHCAQFLGDGRIAIRISNLRSQGRGGQQCDRACVLSQGRIVSISGRDWVLRMLRRSSAGWKAKMRAAFAENSLVAPTNSLLHCVGNFGHKALDSLADCARKIAAEDPTRQNSLFFSLLAGNLLVETGSIWAASTTTQSTANRRFPVSDQ